MAFTSKIYPGEKFVDHGTNNDELFPSHMGRGLMYPVGGPQYADCEAVSDFPSALLIPESELPARIQEIEEKGMRLSEQVMASGLPCKDQERTNYCWVNAPTHCAEVCEWNQNGTVTILSPASVGAPIKNFRNQGGWGLEALEYGAENGWVPVDKWPANAIERQYYTDANNKLRANYRVTEWWNLKTEQECWSYHLRVMLASACGYAWWSHETTRYEPVWIDGELCWRDRNSWGMDFGYRGFFLLRGSRKQFDDCVAPRVIVAS